MTTKRLAIVAVALLAVLLALAVVALVLWRNDVAQREHEARYDECMESYGLAENDPSVDVETFAEFAALCGEQAQQ